MLTAFLAIHCACYVNIESNARKIENINKTKYPTEMVGYFYICDLCDHKAVS